MAKIVLVLSLVLYFLAKVSTNVIITKVQPVAGNFSKLSWVSPNPSEHNRLEYCSACDEQDSVTETTVCINNTEDRIRICPTTQGDTNCSSSWTYFSDCFTSNLIDYGMLTRRVH